MEELLNKLIEKGWKPRNVISKNTYIYKVEDKINLSYSEFLEDEWEVMHEDEWYNLRDLVSKSSWLWQFVCENGMFKKEWEYRAKRRHCHWWEHDEDFYHDISYTKKYDYEYRLIESALKDESELEQFLLDNIKIDE